MDIVQAARKYAVDEIGKYGSPHLINFKTSEKKALELATKLDVDKEIVSIGVYLMDIKLGQAIKEKHAQDHVDMSVVATKIFLEQYSIDQSKKDKIINCVAAHHKYIPYTCLEAEICANADCYRFMEPKGIFLFIHILSKERQMEFKKILESVEAKLEEKHNILSLDICKNELAENYKVFKKMLSEIKDIN